MVQFGDVASFVEEAKDAKVCPQLLPQLQAILSDPERLMNLKLELAATIDVGALFVEATYFLEGDGPLGFACYEKLSAVSQFCQAPCFPNVRAIATAISEEDPCQNLTALERSAKACFQQAITQFLSKFNVDLYDVMVAFKAARLFCPVRIQWLKPTNVLVESLRVFPFLDSDTTIDGLKAELKAELKVDWWCGHEEQLPRWAFAVKQVLLVQPSSATVERVFSTLKASFNEQQNCALVDYLEASVMSLYNKF